MKNNHWRVSQRITGHLAYSPGEQPSGDQRVVKLNTNENPYPPSPSVQNAINQEINLLNLYPNPVSHDLRQVIADLHGLNASQIIVGNGSDDLLNLCVRCFSDEELKVGMLHPSYSLYEVIAGVQGSEMVRIPFQDSEFSLDLAGIKLSKTNLFFLTNPHAPSGRVYTRKEIRNILDGFSGLLVIDEAYADFAPQNGLPLLQEYENLIITRTLSKSYSLAGLRIGYAMGHPNIVQELDKVREVYNVDRLAQAGASAALLDQMYFKVCLRKVIEQRDFLAETFKFLGWPFIPSGANFIFVQPLGAGGEASSENARSLFQYLNENKILVRYFPDHPLTNSYLRISIGKPDQMSMLVDVIKRWTQREKQT